MNQWRLIAKNAELPWNADLLRYPVGIEEELMGLKPIANRQLAIANSYIASTTSSRPKVKFGRFRPFMYFAAVCESAVIKIGKAMVASQFT